MLQVLDKVKVTKGFYAREHLIYTVIGHKYVERAHFYQVILEDIQRLDRNLAKEWFRAEDLELVQE